MISVLLEWDERLFLFLNGLNHPWLDPVMYAVSERFLWIPFYFLLTVLLWRLYRRRVFLILLFVFVLIGITDQTCSYLKSTTERPRPSREQRLEGQVHTVYGYRGGRYGFVSAHAANSFALAFFVAALFRGRNARQGRGMSAILFPWAAAKGYSRIYLGVHYPGDVLAGTALGLGLAWLFVCAWRWAEAHLFPREGGI